MDHIWLHRYAVLVAVCTLMLVVAGGLVTSNDAALAVPDWPLSYGSLMPPMEGGIFYEHGHRMIAATTGLLTIGLAAWLWRAERRAWLRRLGVIAAAAVVVQGVLGGLTVLYPVAKARQHRPRLSCGVVLRRHCGYCAVHFAGLEKRGSTG